MTFSIDPDSAVMPFEQLRVQAIEQMSSGALQPGDKLPSVRKLASELGLAANTVARTYRELEAQGFVSTRGRHGTIVAPRLEDAQKHEKAHELTQQYFQAMSALGLDAASTREYVETGLKNRE